MYSPGVGVVSLAHSVGSRIHIVRTVRDSSAGTAAIAFRLAGG
jgi:hypothetical protein